MGVKLRNYFYRNQTLLMSFWLPTLIMLAYFVYRGFYPFGSSSLLTVDMGQQYVDFFKFYRESLLHHPTNFFYSFSKAIGGEMAGEWAYYLLSPFNLLLLPFGGTTLTAGILLVTLAKFGCSGLAMGWWLRHNRVTDEPLIPAFSTAYALMGWMIANQLNLLWLDGAVFLPLIVMGLQRMLNPDQFTQLTANATKPLFGWGYYVSFLTVMLVANYYMGYMICFFTVIYVCWDAFVHFTNWRALGRKLAHYLGASALAGGLSAIILVPTFLSLLSSKVQYSTDSYNFKFEYAPYKMLSKLFIGSFNFNQMPSGYPNIFVGGSILLLAAWYFFKPQLALKTRLASLVVTAFLILSMCVAPLDLLWHAGQFPVWYPYRFSFIICFWLIYLAATTISQPLTFVNNWLAGGSLLVIVALGWFFYVKRAQFDYLTPETIGITVILWVCALILLCWHSLHPAHGTARFMLGTLMVVSGSLNVIYSLNNISYLSQAEWATPTKALAQNSAQLQKLNSSWYRTAQLYSRTKNDALANGFNAGSYFSSALESKMPNFYALIGNPDGDNYVAYSNGTKISDGLLDMKYYLSAKDSSSIAKNAPHPALTTWSERPDVTSKKSTAVTKVASNNWTNIYANKTATSIAYLSSKSITKLKATDDDPVTYQTNWLNAVTGKNSKYFTAENFDQVVFGNVKAQTNLTNQVFTRTNLAKAATITFKFTPTTNNTYYLSLGPNLSSDYATFSIGNRELNQYSTWRHTVLVAVASHQKGHEVVITVKFKKSSLWLNNFVLYQMNDSLVTRRLKQVKRTSLAITHASSRSISGTITTKRANQWLTTTIPYSKGWRAYVDGKRVATTAVQSKTFVAINIKHAGKHQVTFKFTPPGWWLGSGITALSCLICGLLGWHTYRRKRS